MPVFIIDIDGSLADIRPRLAKAGQEPLRDDPAKYQAWVDRVQDHKSLRADIPISGMSTAISALARYGTLHYVTGRAEQYRSVTLDWLEEHLFPLAQLHMRGNEDWRAASEYKEETIKRLLLRYPKGSQVVAIDDDGGGDCEAMYKKNGWTMLKVIV